MPDDYLINGYVLPCPTAGRWIQRQVLDVQGDGRPIYAPVRAFEMRWELQNYGDWEVLVAAFNEFQSTGSPVVNLPAYPTITGTGYGFSEYSGVAISEPQIGDLFNQEYPTSVVLVISNIRTP